jgi:UDPglucose 6-dehydrogenase
MTLPVIGFAGMTHLGLVSGVSAAVKGFSLVCYDSDASLIANIKAQILPVSEPQLDQLVVENKDRLSFTSRISDLHKCDVVYVASDVVTDDNGQSDLTTINNLLDDVYKATRTDTVLVVLSQVPPGFTRLKYREDRTLYYQVETLIFGRAVERALNPERYIIGCLDPLQKLPKSYLAFLEVHGCPLMPMRYESAELAKISINMCLVASISTANTLAELCESIGADWSEIVPALRLDKRIGPYSYLSPGLGIAGGNLERDLATVRNLADQYGTDAGVVRAWIENSQHRKNWAVNTVRGKLLKRKKNATVAVWGLAYKENTDSTKNSSSLVAISHLQDIRLKVYDPLVTWSSVWHANAEVTNDALSAVVGADALMIMTPWPEFKDVDLIEISKKMTTKLILDPYGIFPQDYASSLGFEILTLGK